MIYPHVLGEIETLDQVLAGRSLARFGDSEVTLVEGQPIMTQDMDAGLSARLGAILRGESGDCLVGIPNLLAPIERAVFWDGYPERIMPLLDSRHAYASAFVSRPDVAPWLDVPDYWQKVEALWADQDVTLVRGHDPVTQPDGKLTGAVSLVKADLTSARSVTEIIGPSVNAWATYSDLLAQCDPTKRTLICLGATATVMAVDLCAFGGHAIDVGHLGLFLHRHRQGLPMKRDKRRKVA